MRNAQKFWRKINTAYARCRNEGDKTLSLITTVDSVNDMAVREKRAVRRCESCCEYAILKSCRFGIRSPARLFHI